MYYLGLNTHLTSYLWITSPLPKIMLVGNHQRLAKVEKFCVKASDRTLSRVFKFKYLGVVLDPYSPGMTILTTFHPKYYRAWACYGKPERLFHERLV